MLLSRCAGSCQNKPPKNRFYTWRGTESIAPFGSDLAIQGILQKNPEKWIFLELRREFLNPKSSFQDDRNAIGTGAIFPVVSWLALWGCFET
jgi:hypothetical protein